MNEMKICDQEIELGIAFLYMDFQGVLCTAKSPCCTKLCWNTYLTIF